MAYEDKRTITPSGLLSTAGKPSYTPKPINLSFPSSGKPDPTHKNPDKEAKLQHQIQQQQLMMQANAGAGGGSIICTAYYALGWMDQATYEADELFGMVLMSTEPGLMYWYYRHAPWFVVKVYNSWLFRWILWLFVKPWSEHMAYEVGFRRTDNWFGRTLMSIGRFLAKLELSRDNKARDFEGSYD